jgi:hypothetical protein
LLCGNQQNTLPSYPQKGGPKACLETTPQNLMLLKANVNEYECKIFDVPPDYSDAEESQKRTESKPTRATLLYEIWDGKQRKMRIKVNKVIPLKKWVHIAITAKANDSYRPDVAVYINGTQVFIEPSGHLPQTKGSTNNYLGKSKSAYGFIWKSNNMINNIDEFIKIKIDDLNNEYNYKINKNGEIINYKNILIKPALINNYYRYQLTNNIGIN